MSGKSKERSNLVNKKLRTKLFLLQKIHGTYSSKIDIYCYSDDAMVKTCVSGQGCEFMTYGQAKGLEAETISAIAAAKGESAVSKALSPTLAEMQESLNALKAQKAVSIYGKIW